MNEKIKDLMNNEYFTLTGKENKNFIIRFDKEMQKSGFEIDNKFCEGAYWGKIINYAKSNVKNKKNIARISILDSIFNKIADNNDISLRLFFAGKDIDKNMKYIENAPPHIKLPFLNDQGLCKECSGENGWCHNRKIYTLNGQQIKKCGYVFTFTNLKTEHIRDYIGILTEFYAKKTKNEKTLKE
jgi:hypothetical protein